MALNCLAFLGCGEKHDGGVSVSAQLADDALHAAPGRGAVPSRPPWTLDHAVGALPMMEAPCCRDVLVNMKPPTNVLAVIASNCSGSSRRMSSKLVGHARVARTRILDQCTDDGFESLLPLLPELVQTLQEFFSDAVSTQW